MRSPHFLAFSFGASHLCAVHLRMSASGRCDLLDFRVEPIDFSSSDPLLWLKACSERLSVAAAGFKRDLPAGFVIPGHVALSKYLKIPQVPAAKRPRIVALEARQNIPYPIEEVTWGYSVVTEDELDFDVLIGATRTEVSEAIARYSREAGLKLNRIEPSTAALINGFRYNYPELSDCSLILSVGAKSTELLYVERGRYHSRNVPFGGQSISVEIAESLDSTIEEGERIKRAAVAGDPLTTGEHSVFVSVKQRFLTRLSTEIARTAAMLQRQGYEFKASRCFLAGGGAALPGIEESLGDKLHLPVERYDPLRKLHVPNEALRQRLPQHAQFLADAVGLGVGRFLPDAVSVDLIPRSLLWQRAFRRQQPFYLGAAVVACAAVILPIFNAALEIRTYQQEIESLDLLIRPLSQLNQDIHQRTTRIQQLQKVIESASAAADLRQGWPRALNDLQERLLAVEDVWLDKLRLVRGAEPAPAGRGQARVRRTEPRAALLIEGRLIDVRNPLSSVSPDSYERVKALLESFRGAAYVASLENEHFDYSVPGILKFDFTLVVNEEAKL